MKIKLTKTKSTNNRLRTSTILGITRRLPKLDERFEMVAEGLKFGTRVISTSPVTKIFSASSHEEKNTLSFTTQNSTYTLNILQ